MEYEKKLWVVKKVDCFALSDMRLEALKGYKALFGEPSEDEIREISNICYLKEESVREAINSNL